MLLLYRDDDMKRYLCILILLIITGCSFSSSVNDDKKEENNENNDVHNVTTTSNSIFNSNFININFDELLKKYDNGEKLNVFIGKDNCPTCIRFKSVVSDFALKENVVIYFLNTNALTEEQFEKLERIVIVEYVPTFVIFDNKNILFNFVGYKSYDELKDVIDEYYR